MSSVIDCRQTLDQLVSLMEFGFLKVHQKLLRQDILLSNIEANANSDAELATLRQKDLLNILRVIHIDTQGLMPQPSTKASYESDFDDHVKSNLPAWTFHYSPLRFKIRY